MLSLAPLADRIRMGADPDLYLGIRGLDRRFPVTPEVSDAFMRVAEVILRMYPDRTRTTLQTSYDARIIAMEFCGNPKTRPDDVLRVLSPLIVE
jgi:hypothetical protein